MAENTHVVMPQNVIALVSDLDMTLTPEYTQKPLLRRYGIPDDEFWKDVNGRYARAKDERQRQLVEEESRFPEGLRVPVEQLRADYTEEMVYANVILEYVRSGRMKGLSRKILREVGQEIEFFPGVPEFIGELKRFVGENPKWKKHDVKLEFYVISSAIADMIRGSKIMPFCDGIYAFEFGTGQNDRVDGEIDRVNFPMSYTEKTRFIHKITKGDGVDVNDPLPAQMRRVRGDCIIYVGDGPTDVPAMSTTNNFGGKCIAVYGSAKDAFDNAIRLREQNRVVSFSEANYIEGSQTIRTLKHMITENAERIVRDRETAIAGFSGRSPRLPS